MKLCKMQLSAIWLFIAMPAIACESLNASPTEDQIFAASKSVFLAHLLGVEEVGDEMPNDPGDGGNGGKIVEGTFSLIETIKGIPPKDHKIRSLAYGTGNCAIPLLAGNDYLFFLGSTNFVGLSGPGFGEPLINYKNGPTQEKLGELRQLARKSR